MLTRIVWLAVGALLAIVITVPSVYLFTQKATELDQAQTSIQQQESINEAQATIIYEFINTSDPYDILHKYAD